jgi:pimeloyl-ACP methyl ester carboxylesterase
LIDVLAKASVGTVHVFGHSLGGGVALACNSPQIAGRVLVAPAGIVRLRVPPSVLVASIPWLMRPTYARSVKLLRPMHGPGHEPSPLVAEWMTLVGSVCRSSLAPSPLPESWLESLRGSNVVASGEHDVFLPPRALRSRARSALRSEVQSIDGAGHLAPDEYPEQMVQLISSAMRMSGAGSSLTQVGDSGV